MLCGEFDTLSVTVIVDEEDCTAVGENVSESVQVAPPASDAPQLFVCAKGAVAWMPVIDIAPGRLLYIVTLVVLLVVPAAWLPKFTEAGEKVTGTTPLPVSATDCGEFPAESVITIEDE
jgi:hypothetical protein